MSISFPLHSCLLTPSQCHLFFGGGVVQSLSRDWLIVTPCVCTDSCHLSQWYYPTILCSAMLFSFCLQSFPALGPFPLNQLFSTGGQSIGVPASVLSVSIQSSFPLWLTSLICILSKGLSRVFSSTIIQKQPFFGTQPSLWSNSHICIWLLEKL